MAATAPRRKLTESVTATAGASQSITVNTHAPASAANGSRFTVAATAPGGPVDYSSSGGCSNVGATFTMTSATTPCAVHYDQPGNGSYSAAPQVTESVTATAGASQSITVNTHAPASAANGSRFTVAATAPGGPVDYSSSGGCSNVGATFTMTSATTPCAVHYDQPGNGSYSAAPQVTESVTATAGASQNITITIHAPASAAYGSQFTVAATAPGGPVTFSSADDSVCSNVGATFTVTGPSGICTVQYDQPGNAKL